MVSTTGRSSSGATEDPRVSILRRAIVADLEGRVHDAIPAYEEAINLGYRGADVWFRLGKLLRDSYRFGDAVPHLERACGSEQYATASRFYLGECYRELGDLHRAVGVFEHVLVDLDLQSARREDIDALVDTCDEIAVAFQRQGELGMAATLYQRLAKWLQAKRWRRDLAGRLSGVAEELGRRSIAEKLRHISSGESITYEPLAVCSDLPPGARLLARLPSFIEPPQPVTPGGAVAGAPAPGGSRRSGGFLKSLFRSTTDELPEATRPQFSSPPIDSRLTDPSPSEIRTEPVTRGLAGTPPAPVVPAPVEEKPISAEAQASVEGLLSESAEYLRQGLYFAAAEACFDVVARMPGYLPAHLRLGEVNVRRERSEDAVAKYQTVIEVCEVRGKPEEAIEAYRLLLQAEPHNAKERVRLANLLAEHGQDEAAAEQRVIIAEQHLAAGARNKAVEEFARAQRLAPSAGHLHVRFARALEGCGEHERSLAVLREVSKFDPHNVDALSAECITAAQGGSERFWDALSRLLEALQEAEARQVEVLYQWQTDLSARGGNVLLRFALGVLQARREDWVAAAQQLERVLADLTVQPVQDVDNTAVQIASQFLLGRIYMGQNRSRQATEILRECLTEMSRGGPLPECGTSSLLPRRQQVEELLVEALLRLGNVSEAVAVLSDLKHRAPDDPHLYTRLAELHFRQGQLSTALKELEDLAALYVRTGEANKAMEVVRQMTVLAPRSIAVRKKLVDMYHARGMVNEELRELDVLADVQSGRGFVTEAARTLGVAARFGLTLARRDDAARFIDRMVKMAPQDATARQEAVTMYLQLGMMHEAIEQQQAVAAISLRAGNIKEGLGAVQQVLALVPDNAAMLKQFGDLLRSVGQYGEAAKLYARLAAQHPEDEEWVALRALMEREAAEHGGSQDRG